jgi:hypothetical protein
MAFGGGTNDGNINTTTFTVVPGGTTTHFIIVEVVSNSTTNFVNNISSSNITWSTLIAATTIGTNKGIVFIGQVNTATSTTVTLSVSSGSPTIRGHWHEFTTSVGYSSVTLDTSATLNASTLTSPSLTPGHGAGELYFFFGQVGGSMTAGSTSGFTYFVDGTNSNGSVYNTNCTTSAQAPVWGGTAQTTVGIAFLLYEVPSGGPTIVQNASATAAISSGSSTTTTATFSTSTTNGNCLVACIYPAAPFGGTTTITSVTTNGSAENWASAVQQVDTAGGGDIVAIWVNPNTGGSQTVIDVNWSYTGTPSSTNQGFILIDIFEVSGVAKSAVVDKTASGTGSAAGTFSSGASGTTTQASEIVIGMVGAVQNAGATMTVTGPSSPWVNETTRNQGINISGTTYQIYELSGYDILSSTGTATYSGTLSSTSNNYASALVTLKTATPAAGRIIVSYI